MCAHYGHLVWPLPSCLYPRCNPLWHFLWMHLTQHFSFISQLHAPLFPACFRCIQGIRCPCFERTIPVRTGDFGRIEYGHLFALLGPTWSGVEWPVAKACMQRMVHRNGRAPGQRRRRTVPAFLSRCAWCFIARSLSAYYHTFQATMVLLGPRREEKPVARKVGSERSVSGLRAGSGSVRKFSDEMIICRK